MKAWLREWLFAHLPLRWLPCAANNALVRWAWKQEPYG